MLKLISNKSGFSLIELIVVMVLLALLALVGSFGISNAVKSYLSQKSNSATAYKGQLAMMRMSKEFKRLTYPVSGSGTSIEYTVYRNGAKETHKLSWSGTSGDSLLYDDFSSNGIPLVDQVSNFMLEYYDPDVDGTGSTWSSPGSTWSSSTRIIGVTLGLIGTDNISSVFTEKITPRNLP